MGSTNSKPEIADLDIYFCGITQNSIYYRIIKTMFKNEDNYYNNTIRLTNRNNRYYINNEYSYNYRYFIQTIENINNEKRTIKYNSYIFTDIPVNENFSRVLSFYLREYDVHNNRKNVIVSFTNENQIQNSINLLISTSNESLPIRIFISDHNNYDDRLDYVNYIPSIANIRTNLLNGNDNPDNDIDIHEQAERAFITYLQSKLFRIYVYYNELGYNLNFINPLNEINNRIQIHATIALVGESGCGKSTLLNFVFNELVARVNTSSKDVTTKCSEYYLPVKVPERRIGQLRFLDFPGLKGESNYEIVKKEILKKINEYRKNLEQIDIALFYISNGNIRDINENSKNIINLLHENNIRIIFILNGIIRLEDLEKKKQALKNEIGNDEILNDNFDNFVTCDYKLEYDLKRRDGISSIFSKINDIIRNGVDNYNINNINIDNYENELETLSINNRIFQNYPNFEILQQSIKLKSQILVATYSLCSLGSSFINLAFPVVDTFVSIGFQTAMVFNLLKFYNENPSDYDKVQIIVSNGDTIRRNTNKNINYGYPEINSHVIGLNSRMVIEASKEAIKNSIKEAGKEAAKTAVNIGLKETAKKLTKEGMKESIEIAINAGLKETAKKLTKEGVEEAIEVTAKETVKQVSEQIIAKQGSKVWLVNLGKCVPFIGVGISMVFNTYSTAKTGHKLLIYLEKNCMNNKHKRVNIIKSKILSVQNIIRQVETIIEEQRRESIQQSLLIN